MENESLAYLRGPDSLRQGRWRDTLEDINGGEAAWVNSPAPSPFPQDPGAATAIRWPVASSSLSGSCSWIIRWSTGGRAWPRDDGSLVPTREVDEAVQVPTSPGRWMRQVRGCSLALTFIVWAHQHEMDKGTSWKIAVYSFILSLSPFHSFKEIQNCEREREGRKGHFPREMSLLSATDILRKASRENGSLATERKISY